jgi:hypothetical protein
LKEWGGALMVSSITMSWNMAAWYTRREAGQTAQHRETPCSGMYTH